MSHLAQPVQSCSYPGPACINQTLVYVVQSTSLSLSTQHPYFCGTIYIRQFILVKTHFMYFQICAYKIGTQMYVIVYMNIYLWKPDLCCKITQRYLQYIKPYLMNCAKTTKSCGALKVPPIIFKLCSDFSEPFSPA